MPALPIQIPTKDVYARAIKLKQQLILTDPSYNGTNTLYRNAYERYLLAAVKLSVYCKELWIADGKRPLNPIYLYSKWSTFLFGLDKAVTRKRFFE